ncbi:hypothetical protein PVAP13_8NG213200 [Panicum virgatum]|uniref:Uncharacterized protein n=1 Tax=Panicum virgatum TaxID=38727 RepID=A0A8T0P4P1_PANVG|nr:hypothetical protein PVAP13_8NG213200 [Panicum virgatum]KAG2557110.1 hypothetical protein PVAP13_8NG213200 [Panicum virgatum]KAG2557111.1 hypothetical protein PVAP13_8NG213200 [Panicum virgatum]
MADLVLGLAKTTVEGTVTMARLAMEEEDKLKKSVQRDLLVISDEFEMMHAFLEDAKGRVTDNVTRTLVRQVRNTALDVEDCIETIVHLDNKPHWWRRMMPPWCMPAAPPGKDLDAVVASVEQLKARVDAMALRRLRYNGVDDCCHKPAEHQHAAIATSAATAAAKQSGQVDLITLINGKGGAERGQARQGNDNDDEKDENIGNNNDDKKEDEDEDKDEDEDQEIKVVVGNKTEEGGIEPKGKQEIKGPVSLFQRLRLNGCRAAINGPISLFHRLLAAVLQPQEVQPNTQQSELKVISVLGTGSDLDMMFIKKAYDYSATCDNFKCRAWVKLVHPLNPIEFIRSLLAQFQKNACQEQGNTGKVLEAIVVPEDVLIEMFMTQISQKYLVVLEDMSTMVDWEAVKGYLPDNKDGSCIVVHTRHHGIALSCVGHQYPISEVEMTLADHSVRVVFKKGVAGKDSDEDTGNGKESKYEDWEKKNPLYGRDEDLRWLSFIQLWLSGSIHGTGSLVFSLWGISGVGKSFLIEHFYRKVKEKVDYRKIFRVDVSRPFDLRDVRKSLPPELLKPGPEGSNPGPEGSNPGPKGSKNVRNLIIIDGLQSTEEWDRIRRVFKCTTTSSTPQNSSNAGANIPENVCIIIITDEESVANYCATGKSLVRNVKSLEAGHAIKLFNQVANKNLFFALHLSPPRPHNGNLPIHLPSFYPYAPQINPGVKLHQCTATDSSTLLWAINNPVGTVVSPSAIAFFAFFFF